MTRALPTLLGLALITPVALAQQLPPPRNPARDDLQPQQQGPALVAPQPAVIPPQNAPQQPRAPLTGQSTKQTPAQLRAVLATLRQAEKERKQARIDRMNQFKAARAAEEQKLYQDWHDRYLADAPVRVEYYRALAAAYQSQPAISYYTTPYYYGAGPSVILPPIYAPVIAAPVYGTFFYGGW
jgi:hypothetical protein